MRKTLLFIALLSWIPALHATPCGNTNASSGNIGGNANLNTGASACIVTELVTVNSCSITVNANPGSAIECAVYANSGTKPSGAAICVSASATAVVGVNTLTLTGCGTLAAGTYWIVANTNGSTLYAASTSTPAPHGAYITGVTYNAVTPASSFTTGSSSWLQDDGANASKFLILSIDVTPVGGTAKKRIIVVN